MRFALPFVFLLLQAQDDVILQKADAILEESKAAYEKARESGTAAGFIDAGFRLEEARIKYLVLQEIGTGDKQKIAIDRLRAVNQLGKLIHDGKVAVTGSAVDVPVANAPDAPVTPKPAAPAPTVDVSRRAGMPDAAKLKEADRLIKDLFKDQYARKTPADRQALARQMIKEATTMGDDPAALWVLYREAQDLAVQGGDIKSALEAIEASARVFDVDAASLKNQMLMGAVKTAKSNEEFIPLTEALIVLVEELVRLDLYDAAEKAMAGALLNAKKVNDPILLNRVGIRSKEVSEARTLYQGLKRNLETLAKNPDDATANSEMGKYLCFAKGSWDLGLRFMVKGGDAALKALAQRDLASTTGSASDRVGIGDSWYDLGEKEKSSLRKTQMLLRAKTLYESAVSDVPALVRAKIAKRVETIDSLGVVPGQPGAPGSTDITSLTPRKAAVGFGQLEVNTTTNNATVLLNGKPVKKYIFAHADSALVYDIPPGTKQFLATGIRLDRGVPGTWKYIVHVDGKKLYESKPLNEVKNFEVDILVNIPAGAGEITLITDKCVEYSQDWSTWAYPRFQK